MATRILERVEIDHTPLKIVVGTEAGPLGQPWLTVLVDYYSRMIVGFCIGFEPPSYAVIMDALRHAILPKSYVRERYPSITNDWPCFGIPSKLVCDRGSDLTSKDLENAAFQLGIELDFTPPRTPNFKGTVESFFDSLNDLLLSSLPDRTFRSWERRADYNPDEGPLLPYATLVEIIHLHLIDVHSQQRHPAATKSRLEMRQESSAEFPFGIANRVGFGKVATERFAIRRGFGEVPTGRFAIRLGSGKVPTEGLAMPVGSGRANGRVGGIQTS